MATDIEQQRNKLKSFVQDSICPNDVTRVNKDLRVDVFGNFEVNFNMCTGSFAKSSRIKTYGDLGNSFFNTEMHQFIKSINDFELNINATPLSLPGMSYALHRLMPMNPQNSLQMMWLNTKTPYIETVFVPWMQDNTINGSFPIIKADLKITFPKLKESNSPQIQYIYYGVRPIEVGMHKMTNEPLQEFYRRVVFDFDYFYCKPQGTLGNINI